MIESNSLTILRLFISASQNYVLEDLNVYSRETFNNKFINKW